ncbi:Unknown protein [Striga hermonthica]|uniref:DUF3741 domain-containing protein n=1 Tax=Striga hermonthica TaxID=68872 RepID=A0A9N7NEJ5_STRHE|nr:Unknown protein [Striga hermonthica]
MSLFLLKNSFGSKMKKGFGHFCNGESSTSILKQQKVQACADVSRQKRYSSSRESHRPSLEEMIMQLEMEEEKNSSNGRGIVFQPHRMSCVDSCDILRTARNALNQYPRFSLDGKDSMYRSSFVINKLRKHQKVGLPCEIGGERVIWCKPGVVAKLMGLDAVPIPLNNITYRTIIKKRIDKERTKLLMAADHKRREMATRYSLVNPTDLQILNAEAGWPMRRFH